MHTLLVAVLAALPFVAVLPAQQVNGGPDPDRRATAVTVNAGDQPLLAAVYISYGAPTWREGHDPANMEVRSNYTRLGLGWWTTLDTIGAIEIGGTRIAAGSYYVGLRVNEGKFSLLLFDSKVAMQKRLLPSSTPLYTGEAKAELAAPLTLAKHGRKEVVAKLEFEITADQKEPSKGLLTIRWGPYEATAPVKFELGVTRNEAGGKK